MNRILIIGNVAGGKSVLARRLSQLHHLPLCHIDAIQFLPGMHIRPLEETRSILREFIAQDRWILDGYGPLDLLETHFARTEVIIFIDFPLWRHYWWCTKRQVKSLWRKREELPEGCNEATLAHTSRLLKTIWKSHHKMRPELLRLLHRSNSKTIFIRNISDWNSLYQSGSLSVEGKTP